MRIEENEQIGIPWNCLRMCRQGRKGQRNGEETDRNLAVEMVGHAV